MTRMPDLAEIVHGLRTEDLLTRHPPAIKALMNQVRPNPLTNSLRRA